MKLLKDPKALVIAQFVLMGLLFFWPDQKDAFGFFSILFAFCGVIFFFVGIILVILAIRSLFAYSLPKLTGDFKQKATQAFRVVWPEPGAEAKLIQTGVFKRMRHPVYAGLLWMAYGIGIASGFAQLFFAVVLHVVLFNKAALEEGYLSQKFANYKTYAETTGRFWPKVDD